jgi:hypothetical protein
MVGDIGAVADGVFPTVFPFGIIILISLIIKIRNGSIKLE